LPAEAHCYCACRCDGSRGLIFGGATPRSTMRASGSSSRTRRSGSSGGQQGAIAGATVARRCAGVFSRAANHAQTARFEPALAAPRIPIRRMCRDRRARIPLVPGQSRSRGLTQPSSDAARQPDISGPLQAQAQDPSLSGFTPSPFTTGRCWTPCCIVLTAA